MKETTLYKFSGADSIVQFGGWFCLMVASLPLFALPLAVFAGVVSACVLVVLGFRNSIVVTSVKVTIKKKWFFVPYRRYEAEKIDDVWYDGDWGLDEGAIGVVVRLGKEEIPIGSRRKMHELHDALFPLTSKFKNNFQRPATRSSADKHSAG